MRAFALLLVLWTLVGLFFGLRYAEKFGERLAPPVAITGARG